MLVAVGTGVSVGVGGEVGTGGTVAEGSGMEVGDGGMMEVAVGVGVLVAVGVLVTVGVCPGASTSHSSGRKSPSRELKVTLSLLSGRNTKLKRPLPVMWAVTLYSTQLFDPIAPTLSKAAVVGSGWLLQVIPVSSQLLEVPNMAGPSEVLLVARSRKVAFWITPVTPVTLKRR